MAVILPLQIACELWCGFPMNSTWDDNCVGFRCEQGILTAGHSTLEGHTVDTVKDRNGREQNSVLIAREVDGNREHDIALFPLPPGCDWLPILPIAQELPAVGSRCMWYGMADRWKQVRAAVTVLGISPTKILTTHDPKMNGEGTNPLWGFKDERGGTLTPRIWGEWAAIVPEEGDSGSPLVNDRGEIAGMLINRRDDGRVEWVSCWEIAAFLERVAATRPPFSE